MASPDSVPVDIVRKRSEKAVEYYKTRVVPKYPTRPGTASPVRVQNYDSVENINGIYTSHKVPTGRHIDSSRKGKSQVGFKEDQNRKSSDKHNDSFTRGGHRATIHGTNASKSWKQSKSRGNKEKRSPKSPSSPESGEDAAGFKRRSRGLYRSNSNLEMDSIEYVDIDDFHNTSLMHRDYGSTSSLDVLGTSSDSFFAMLKDYGVSNLDQRSPAPDKLQEVLRGRLDSNKERDSHRSAGKKVSNGLVPSERLNDDNADSPRSKSKFKSKDRKSRAKSITSENRPGIFTKLRGKPEAESGARTPDNIDMDLRAEERQRWKAFVHLDCQSMGFDLQTVIKNQKSESSIASKNTSTGASAASGQNRNSYAADKDGPDIIADTDDGDGKSNDLVLSCPFFRNEIGSEEERSISLGRTGSSNRKSQQSQNTPLNGAILLRRSPACCGVSILDSLPTPTGLILPHVVLHRGHVMEYVDHGASYYRHFFYGYDHQNYFGVDETLGPVAVSFRKEKVEDRENNLGKSDYGYTQYRIIFRTSELTTLRGTVIEDAIPSSASRLGGSRTTTVKDVLEFAVPELQTSCLKTALSTQKTLDQLMKLDEQGVNTTYKVGIMYCKTGQSSEEDMYNNEHSGPAFEEFLSCMGQKVRLKGFEKYRAQLDNKTDSTGTYSLYTTFNNSEMMFHVSTMLPFTPNNQQQLLRKRHIGNDIVTIVFQEPGALPFTPKTVRSQFQHVFIIVRAHNPCTDNVHYSISVSRSKDVPPFGPHIPENALFPRGPDFADFLLAKIINAENAAHRCEKFCAMATRTRTEYLKDLAMNYVTSTTLDSGSKLSKFALGSGRKKDRAKQKVTPDVYATGAVVWSIQVEDFGSASQVDGILGISAEVLVILEETSKDVIFTVHCGAIIGWTPQANSIRIYFNQGENILVRPQSGEMEETDEICTRLKAITPGWETQEMTLKRNGMGQLGFHIQSEGIVTDVEKHGFAWEAGLRKGSRLVEICKAATATLTHEQMVDLLRTSVTVKVTVIPPMDDGTPRGVATLHTNCHYSSLTTLKAACQATENVQQRQKEALLSRKPSEGEINHRELCKTSSDSSEYVRHQREISNMINSSMEHLNMLFMRKDASKVSLGSTEQIYQHQREVSQLSNSSSEQGHQLKDSMASFSTNVKELTIQLQRRDSARMSSSSSEYNASPTQREPSKGLTDMTDQRGSLTLPLQRKPSTPTRGDIKLPQSKSLTPQYRQMGTSSLQRGIGLHHAYTDSALSTKSSGSYDEGYGSKHTTAESVFRVEDVRHERSGSRDSADYAYLSMSGSRQWNPRSSQNQGNPKWQDSNSSGDSSAYGSHLHMSESTPSMMSLQSNAPSSGGYSRKHSAPGGDYSAPQHGNIALELLKQTQNSKYLLSQGQEHGKNGSSSVNLSDTSFSSGSSQNSGTLPGQRGPGDPIYFCNPSKEDNSVVARKRADISSTNSRGRPVGHVYRKTHLDISPLSSENSSPRSSHRNLSGMSSEESLNTRLRPGVTGKPTKSQSNDQLQEELKCLINLNINNSELRGILSQSEKPPSRLKRTMSDESIHSQKGVTSSKSLNNNLADVIFTSAPPVPALPKEVLQDQRLSPRAMLDSEMAAKARQILSRHSASTQNNNNNNNNVPLPESAASLDWSNLVNVATKAIEGSDSSTSKSQNSLSSDKKESQPSREVPLRDSSKKSTLRQPPNKDVPMKRNTAPVGSSSGNSVWRSTVSNPQQRIQELEAKVEQLEAELDQETKENAALEAEVQELRQDNARLQEESQTAAAQLRKFTEWFFQTIDRQ